MSYVYVAGKPDAAVKSWASLGISLDDYKAVKLPILDLYGDNDLPPCWRTQASASRAWWPGIQGR